MRPCRLRASCYALLIVLVSCSDPVAVGSLYEYSTPPNLGDDLGGTAASARGVDEALLAVMVREIEDGV
jgi:hypothetical protein